MKAVEIVGGWTGGGKKGGDPKAIRFQQHQRNFEALVAAIRDGREPLTSAHEARKAVAVIRAIYENAANGGVRVAL